MRDPLLIRDAETLSRADVHPRKAARIPKPRKVLMADPSHFDIRYAINPHMRTASGGLQTVERPAAQAQWSALRTVYEELGYKVEVVAASPDHPDLVFTANQVFPYLDPHAGAEDVGDGRGLAFVPSRMAHMERRGEVALVGAHLEAAGYRATPLPRELEGSIEGSGDLLWVGDRRLLLGGIGPRTSAAALRAVADVTEIPVVAVELTDPDFYHLDTCLTVIDDRRALWVPQAFPTSAQKVLRVLFEELIEVDDLEARRGLACNAHCPDGRRLIIQRGNDATVRAAEDAGCEVIEVDTSQFIRAGGSVYCMKLMHW